MKTKDWMMSMTEAEAQFLSLRTNGSKVAKDRVMPEKHPCANICDEMPEGDLTTYWQEVFQTCEEMSCQ